MISVYDIGNENFDRNGNVIVMPTGGTVKQVAGGNYEISMTVPMDPAGNWKHLVPGAIVKAPVPKEVIPNAFAGVAADVYKTNTAAELRESPLAPSTVTYSTWSGNTVYEVGNKVSYNSRNYKCTYFDDGSGQRFVPPNNSSWWTEIPRTTNGAPVLVALNAGAELYFVEDANATWYKMSTPYGITGYIEKAKVTYDRHLSPSETQPRVITEQLFRLQEPADDNEHQTVTVSGVHVSYDLSGNLVRDVSFTQASPALALNIITNAFMMDYRGEIATNLYGDGVGTYSEEIKGKNGMFALADPDSGIVRQFDARMSRDNWDLFIMKREESAPVARIAYGKNAKGISWKRSSANLVTRVVPKAKDEKGEDLYLPETWIDSPLINDYPVVKMEMISVKGQVGKDKEEDAGTWTLSDLYDEMRAKAGERFSVDKADQITQEVTVQFEQLGDTADFTWLKPLQDLILYDTVLAEDARIGLSMQLYVTELEYDIVRKKVSGVKLSNVTDYGGRTVTGYNVQNKSIGGNKLKDEVASDIVNAVMDKIPEFADPDASRPATVSVTDGNPTLAWGTQSTVGTVQGTDLHVKMPANPAPVPVERTITKNTSSWTSNNTYCIVMGNLVIVVVHATATTITKNATIATGLPAPANANKAIVAGTGGVVSVNANGVLYVSSVIGGTSLGCTLAYIKQ